MDKMNLPMQPPRLSPSQELLRYFAYEHLPAPLQEISRSVGETAHHMEAVLPDGPEKTTGLRKLLEAKDCFVRAALPPAPAYPLIPKEESSETHSMACGCGLVLLAPDQTEERVGQRLHLHGECERI